jgi:hypothetical protein
MRHTPSDAPTPAPTATTDGPLVGHTEDDVFVELVSELGGLEVVLGSLLSMTLPSWSGKVAPQQLWGILLHV